MRNVVILGSTGSIGENALRVAAALPDRLRVVGLGARVNAARVVEQARRFGVPQVALADPAAAEQARRELSTAVTVHAGDEGMQRLAALDEADVVLCAVVGLAGLRPVLEAVRRGTHVALATKEVLVGAGGLVTEACRQSGARLLPVDSEHNAVFQCLGLPPPAAPPFAAGALADVAAVTLTASGGPFLDRPEIDFERVTPEQALKHPTWAMGRKVTIDSASLMNKGLELLEAHWLFGVGMADLHVLVHPQSLVHALVRFQDGSSLAQMGPPDMRFAIQHALLYPDRVDGALPTLDLAAVGRLDFAAVDAERFPSLRLAREAGERGGTLPVVLNAANEVAVEAFLDGNLRFAGIWRVVEMAMRGHEPIASPDCEAIMAVDAWARDFARLACDKDK